MATLFILANATLASGAGHVMRCAALAEAWHERGAGRAVLLGEVSIPFARRRLVEAGLSIVDGRLGVGPKDVVLVDSYDPEVRSRGAALSGAALRVLTSDVSEPVPSDFDAVWNPNAYGSPGLYPEFSKPVIAGIAAVPLRAGLPTWHASPGSRLGVALGGGHLPEIATEGLARLRTSMPNVSFAVTGGWAPADCEAVRTDKPWDDLVRCQVVITAASVTLWEASAVGVPVVVLQTHDHQRMVLDYAVRHGIPCMNSAEFTDPQLLCDAIVAAIRKACPAPLLVNGAPRVAEMLQQLARASQT